MPLVLLPGLDGTGDLFAPFVGALDPGVKAQPVRYPAQVSDPGVLLAAARAALPTTGDFVLLGESFSGPLAIALAAERPSGLRGLILVCTYARPPRPCLGRLVARLPLPPFAPLLLGSRAPAPLRRDFKRAVGQMPAAILRARLCSIERVDAREALRAVTAPILVLSAARDRIVPARATRNLLRLRPDAQHVALPGPHLLLQREPVAAAGAVMGWMRQLGRVSQWASKDPPA